MSIAKFSKYLSLLVLGLALGVSAHAAGTLSGGAPEGDAPHAGMLPEWWSSGIKQFFGTSFETYDQQNVFSSRSSTAPISRVWFTGAQGILTEVYWPSVDTAQIRDNQFLITDGKSFFLEERRNMMTTVEWIQSGVPAFRVTNRDPKGRFEIQKIIFADPDRDVLVQKIKIIRLQPGLRFYVLHNPAIAMTPMGNNGRVVVGKSEKEALPEGLYAWQRSQAQAVLLSVPLKQASASYSGPTDGWNDLNTDFQMDFNYESALNGNVVETGYLDLPENVGTSEFSMAIGFGTSLEGAANAATLTLAIGVDELLKKYSQQWQNYQKSVRDLAPASLDNGKLFRASVSVLKSSEDKTSEGAFIASPTVPWGLHQRDENAEPVRDKLIAGYHVVWPRDLYQVATTFLALDDPRSAVASLNFLKRSQYGERDGSWTFGSRSHAKNGAFPQNCWVDGTPFWPGLQMDEVAMPVILAYRLWKKNLIELDRYWDMIKRASDFVIEFGPWSPQERWEEAQGASPSTIAAEISSLWVASEMAQTMGDSDRARRYKAAADSWSAKPNDNIETWTFTKTGPYGNGHYFIRVEAASSPDQVWDPNDEASFHLANGGGALKEKAVVDAGFLELVRFGVRSALNPYIVDSIPEIDENIRVEIPNVGPGFYRYTGDRYNYDDTTGVQTHGMIWPFFTGERGHYELARALEERKSSAEIDAVTASYVQTMEKMATVHLLLPEQIWDSGSAVGLPTGSATPLAWTHAEYIKLLRSRADRKVFDMLPSVIRMSTSSGQH